MSNYPPGVTGWEPQIAGWPNEEEFKDERTVWCQNEGCDEFEQDTEDTVDVERWGNRIETHERWYWACKKCGHRGEFEREFDTEDLRPEYDPYED